MRTNSRPMIGFAALAGLCVSAALIAQPASTLKIEQDGKDIVREGSGPRRDALNKMELKAFPADAWSKLSEWTNGSAPTATELQGKVVLICTYKDWYPLSKSAIRQARGFAEKYGSQGLVVIGAHDEDGWSDSEKLSAPANSTFLLAKDGNNELRKQFQSDSDPDFYLIDRAGQMRYADIDTKSVELGITTLLAETSEAAAATKDRLTSEAQERDRKARVGANIQGGTDFRNIPELPWTRPDKELYDKAKWPRLPRDEGMNINEEPQPKPISLPDTDWYPHKPETNGRVIIFYFFHPYMLRSFSEIMPEMDLWQRQLGRDVVLVGVLTNFDRFNGYQIPDREKTPQYLKEQMESYGKSRKFDSYFVCDPNRSMLDQIVGMNNGEIPLPFSAIASSDNLVRWWSHENAPEFDGSLEKIRKVDPGVKVRQDAESAWIKANSQAAQEKPASESGS